MAELAVSPTSASIPPAGATTVAAAGGSTTPAPGIDLADTSARLAELSARLAELASQLGALAASLQQGIGGAGIAGGGQVEQAGCCCCCCVARRGAAGGGGMVPAATTATGEWSGAATPLPIDTAAPAAATSAPADATPAADAQLAAELRDWMLARTPNTPLADHAEEMVAAGRRHGVDPRLIAALSASETSLGTDGRGPSIHNAWGIMRSGGGLREYDSWADGLDSVADILRRLYLDEGLLTLEAIGNKYAPVGASNDPGGLNSHWVPTMTTLYSQLGGDPGNVPRHWS